MSWQRAKFAHALADVLASAATGEGAPTVFAMPVLTLNPPALVIGRPLEVLYGTANLGIDEATVPVACVGPGVDGEDVVDGLIAFVRQTVAANPTVGATVQIATTTNERNWRTLQLAAGGLFLLAADVTLTVQM